MDQHRPFRWARRVEQQKIRRLYESDARGITDEELIDDVGYALLARCESIMIATRASFGDVMCKGCRAIIKRGESGVATVLLCEACGWTSTWGEYHKSYKRQQLHGGAATPAFEAFIAAFPAARTPREKLLAIDALIHACHVSLQHGVASRPAAVNVIEGTMGELLRFLNDLAYTDRSTPGLESTRQQWRDSMTEGARWWAARGERRWGKAIAPSGELPEDDKRDPLRP
jgi:hypothetical protein